MVLLPKELNNAWLTRKITKKDSALLPNTFIDAFQKLWSEVSKILLPETWSSGINIITFLHTFLTYLINLPSHCNSVAVNHVIILSLSESWIITECFCIKWQDNHDLSRGFIFSINTTCRFKNLIFYLGIIFHYMHLITGTSRIELSSQGSFSQDASFGVSNQVTV